MVFYGLPFLPEYRTPFQMKCCTRLFCDFQSGLRLRGMNHHKRLIFPKYVISLCGENNIFLQALIVVRSFEW